MDNQSNVRIRFHDLRGTDKFAFDNLEFFGQHLGPEVVLVEDCIADGPYISGVIDDPTDPIATIGVNVDVSHPSLPPENLTLTASSGNASVVPNDAAHLIVGGAGTHRTVRIIPTGRGYSTITLTVSDGSVSSILNLFYAGAPNGANPAAYTYGAGISDASAAVSLDNNYMLVANDEVRIENSGPQDFPGPQLFLFDRNHSGRACQNWDLSSLLALPQPDKELDLEGATRVGNRIFWIGALGNNKDGECRANRNRLFATDLSGRAPNITLTFGGFYQYMRDDLIAWDVNNWHGKGANYYGFQASAYCATSGGMIPKRIDGFNVEGSPWGRTGLPLTSLFARRWYQWRTVPKR